MSGEYSDDSTNMVYMLAQINVSFILTQLNTWAMSSLREDSACLLTK